VNKLKYKENGVFVNKIVKRVLKIVCLFLILIVVAFGFYVGYFFITYGGIQYLNPTETGRIQNTDIVAIKNGFGTIYLIKNEHGYILFDSGQIIDELKLSLEEEKIDPNNVKWVFLTHSDYDHVSGLNIFPNAEIYMNEDEFLLINGTILRSKQLGFNTLPEGINIKNINFMKNEQEYLFNGIKIKCIKAPGHTIGSMVYLVNEKYLFTGDAFFAKNGKKLYNHVRPMDLKASKKTTKYFREIGKKCELILTSHFGIIYN
jgi:glyoxylase-like metal-dependent hydrolase (beta-lactamase superfamily II)